ncbi:hypothetical protein GCM10012275_62400 [Longimycelium tulufanense]|uniref:Uncharacterized protein n=1 Tax=Longimycelium tulufanense TaxID=907463 RepID=A0A8J3CIR7_9PSEU|nr:hypothetical protein [Longimycelium tulufanense]GGM83315.1 hypothetical protein GCM10012275_62400 [Longimycelium tulufanense]
MGLRKQWKKFRQEWAAAERALERAEQRRARRAPEPQPTVCRYRGCTNTPVSHGYCNRCIATFM